MHACCNREEWIPPAAAAAHRAVRVCCDRQEQADSSSSNSGTVARRAVHACCHRQEQADSSSSSSGTQGRACVLPPPRASGFLQQQQWHAGPCMRVATAKSKWIPPAAAAAAAAAHRAVHMCCHGQEQADSSSSRAVHACCNRCCTCTNNLKGRYCRWPWPLIAVSRPCKHRPGAGSCAQRRSLQAVPLSCAHFRGQALRCKGGSHVRRARKMDWSAHGALPAAHAALAARPPHPKPHPP